MKIDIPIRFQIPPFYNQSFVHLEQSVTSCKEILQAVPFYYDITMDQCPWEDKHSILPQLFEWWKKEQEILECFYKQRQSSEAKEIMVVMIAVFIDALFWLNGRQVRRIDCLGDDVKSLLYKPVNCEERLEFILNAPIKYPSFVQLKSMYQELNKKYAKVKVLEQHKSR
ncbi:hypothetical protein N0O92_06965 [Alkalihalobacillus sp. MEB130]|uniref:YpoC family protein n=1 Tax=Alkalihalobacillus sp. MEB130 TaxID=2976704 RepID=UPI0028E09854|nr:hypothetical protein [Alkalihalobacillus sp. MEB130]MDT8859969.1 hypothetical protein [Alkalihalobacillus sp. MEB130]